MKFLILIFSLLFISFVDSLIKPEECFDLRKRGQFNFNFLVCEGTYGWSSIHIISPLTLTLFFQNIWIALIIPGLFEIFEALVAATLGLDILTTCFDAETVAGSVIGDWLINGFMGVFLGFAIIAITKVPPLLPRYSSIKNQDRRFENEKFVVKIRKAVWFKYLFCGVIFVSILHAFPLWTYPSNCTELDPFSCLNISLALLILVLKPIYLIIYYLICNFAIDQYAMWTCEQKNSAYIFFPDRGRYVFFILWWFVEFTICLQNFPWFPSYLGDVSGFCQPWISVGAWAVIFTVILLILRNKKNRIWFDCKILGSKDKKEPLRKKSIFFN